MLFKCSRMNHYALCPSYRISTEGLCLHVFCQVGPPQRVDCLTPKIQRYAEITSLALYHMSCATAVLLLPVLTIQT